MNKFAHIELDENLFIEKILHYFYKVQNTYLESSFYIKTLNPLEKYIDLRLYENFLKERFSKLIFSIDLDEVNFDYNLWSFSDGTMDHSDELTKKRFEIENLSKEVFWANQKEVESFQKISRFDSFDDLIVPKEKVIYKMVNNPFFNSEAWINYYQDLLDLKFPSFSEKYSSGKKIIKYRQFKENLFLGIENDYSSCRKNFRKGYCEEPEYKLIIFEKISSKKIRKILIFNNFVNPLLHPPTISFGSFIWQKTWSKIGENTYKRDTGTRKLDIGDGNIKIYNLDIISEDLKKHAYFYYDLLYNTTKIYIDFIEESFVS
ncbi:hypothetical protein SAMN05421847_2383 [Halpernia humi]|uniref:Uncharacterized protein n=1 Tax=Halpernia humi TaxID=493375 RepID=A0A1H6AFH8_9FLAO|nr:hypothetical protein [Halpernia humi]SEG46775.1 hypothetical protein SAMN05421847_2383 [Halpernia humi]